MIVNLEVASVLSQMLDRGELEQVLAHARSISHELSIHPGLNGVGLFIPQLDELMLRASKGLVQLPSGPAHKDSMVHVATEVYETGGHTRVIEDIVRAFPQCRHTLILTDVADNYLGNRLHLGFLKERYEALGLEVVYLKKSSLTARAQECATLLREFAPQAIFLFAHHFDTVANAAISGQSAPRVLYVHHCDHNPGLGATRSDYIHLDVSPPAHELCKSIPALSPIFLGLSIADSGRVAAAADRAGLVGVTCATAYKYTGRCEFSYAEFLAAMFAEGVEKLFHIGEVPQAQQDQIRAEIRALRQDERRIEFVGNVPSLAQSLKQIAPDFFLCSYPVGGGKAMIEAMSVGLPTISPRAPTTLPLICADLSMGVSLTIEKLEEVPAAFKKLRAEKQELGERNREMFDRHYSMTAFHRKLSELILNEGTSAQ